MSFLENFGLYAVRALALLARWLGAVTAPVPWPIVVALAAVPVLLVLRFVVWFLRGTAWPVRCKHPITTVRSSGDSACRSLVAGEWRYCRHHNRWYRNSRGQVVDPKLPRWQTVVSGKVIDRTDVGGVGASASLLFYRGFARRPSQVWEALPAIWLEWHQSMRVAFARLRGREVPPEAATNSAAVAAGPTQEEQNRYRGVHLRAVQADQALNTLKGLLPVALLVTAGSVLVPSQFTDLTEYVALLLLWVVVEIARCGLLRAPGGEDWRRQAVKGSFKAFAVVLVVALTCTALDAYVIPFVRETVEASGEVVSAAPPWGGLPAQVAAPLTAGSPLITGRG